MVGLAAGSFSEFFSSIGTATSSSSTTTASAAASESAASASAAADNDVEVEVDVDVDVEVEVAFAPWDRSNAASKAEESVNTDGRRNFSSDHDSCRLFCTGVPSVSLVLS